MRVRVLLLLYTFVLFVFTFTDSQSLPTLTRAWIPKQPPFCKPYPETGSRDYKFLNPGSGIENLIQGLNPGIAITSFDSFEIYRFLKSNIDSSLIHVHLPSPWWLFWFSFGVFVSKLAFSCCGIVLPCNRSIC